jgi:hypothetical protein
MDGIRMPLDTFMLQLPSFGRDPMALLELAKGNIKPSGRDRDRQLPRPEINDLNEVLSRIGDSQNGYQTAPINNLRANIQILLNHKNAKMTSTCGEIVQKLLDVAAMKFPKWKDQNSKTFWEAFDRISAQDGFVAYIPPGISHYGGSVDGDAFASQEGTWARKAIAYLHPFNYYGATYNNSQAQVAYAFTAIHETFHLAARGGYSDKDMAEVVSQITGWKLPPEGSEVTTYSAFWEKYLSLYCQPDRSMPEVK